jgi:Domain of Unknown Function (DUF1080)
MQNLARFVRVHIVAVALATALAVGFCTVFLLHRANAKRNHYATMAGWQPISGRWSSSSDTITNANYGRGDMLIARHSQGVDYKISADIRFDLLFPDTHYGDAGLVIRTTDPEPGVDSYQGYYAGLRPDSQSVVLGRASFDWHELRAARLALPVTVGNWYHLEISANGCHLVVTATPQASGLPTRIDYQDDHCLESGVAGLRSFYAQASWRNVKVTRN